MNPFFLEEDAITIEFRWPIDGRAPLKLPLRVFDRPRERLVVVARKKRARFKAPLNRTTTMGRSITRTGERLAHAMPRSKE